jgi:hypothetical protein
MKATLITRGRRIYRDGVFSELVLWLVPEPVRGSGHLYKYRLALMDEGRCVLRYDNEAGKGDHRHTGDNEAPYVFSTLEVLLRDFEADIRGYLNEHADYRQPDD